jgi:hypothetical protein
MHGMAEGIILIWSYEWLHSIHRCECIYINYDTCLYACINLDIIYKFSSYYCHHTCRCVLTTQEVGHTGMVAVYCDVEKTHCYYHSLIHRHNSSVSDPHSYPHHCALLYHYICSPEKSNKLFAELIGAGRGNSGFSSFWNSDWLKSSDSPVLYCTSGKTSSERGGGGEVWMIRPRRKW